MLSVDKMIQSAKSALGWPYVSPGTNNSSGIDCSGLFVKIFRDQRGSIYHGSNRIFRKYCSETGTLSHSSQLILGMAVFKWKDQQPDGYADNLGDFHHIGLVVSSNPVIIIHASSAAGCVTEDKSIKNWKYWGKLKNVDYSSSKGEDFMNATVYAENGYPVKMRTTPSKTDKNYTEVPVGESVVVLEKGDVWSRIAYAGRDGYMMSKFLVNTDEVPTIDPIVDPVFNGDTVTVSKADLEKAYDLLGNMLGLRG